MNKLNINYSSISIFFEEVEDIDFIKDCNINCNQPKKLEIQYNKLRKENSDEDLFKSLYLQKTANNLIHLTLNVNGHLGIKISKYSFEFINNCKFIEYLELKSFIFETTFIFKLKTLKQLKLMFCKNIVFEKDSLLQLKSLYLDFNRDINVLTNLPELEIIILKYFSLIEKGVNIDLQNKK